jgi:hypothetical protein
MKLHVMFDKEGRILAAAHLPESMEPDGKPSIRMRPIAKEGTGHSTAVLYVPAEHHHVELGQLCRLLKVDTKAKTRSLKMTD